MKEKKGGIMLFLCIILSLVVLVNCIFIGGAYYRKQEVICETAVSHQLEHILANFDRDISSNYGIYTIGDYDATAVVFHAMTEDLEGTQISLSVSRELETDSLQKAISEYIRFRVPAVAADRILEVFDISFEGILGVSSFQSSNRDLWVKAISSFISAKEAWETVLSTAEAIINIIDYENKLDSFLSFIHQIEAAFNQNASRTLQWGDTSLFASIFDPSTVTRLSDFMNAIMEADMGEIGDYFFIREYALTQFDSRVLGSFDGEAFSLESNLSGTTFVEIHDENHSDLEYLAFGFEEDTLNILASSSMLLVFRLFLNIGAFLLDAEKMEEALGIAEVLSALITLVSVGTVPIPPETLQYAVIYVWAYAQAIEESLLLQNGGEVPVVSNGAVDELISQYGMTTYKDYFRPLLGIIPKEILLERMLRVLERDAGHPLYTEIIATYTIHGRTFEMRRRFEVYA
ncbi:MAG TPA: DUF5702 domain-containing protein [Bacillota bacterium]|nr:DUF5702 domain-containing protein [Bacillota bacterium]